MTLQIRDARLFFTMFRPGRVAVKGVYFGDSGKSPVREK